MLTMAVRTLVTHAASIWSVTMPVSGSIMRMRPLSDGNPLAGLSG